MESPRKRPPCLSNPRHPRHPRLHAFMHRDPAFQSIPPDGERMASLHANDADDAMQSTRASHAGHTHTGPRDPVPAPPAPSVKEQPVSSPKQTSDTRKRPSARCHAIEAGLLMPAGTQTRDQQTLDAESLTQVDYSDVAGPDPDMLTIAWRRAKRRSVPTKSTELRQQLLAFAAFTNNRPRPSKYRKERSSWQMVVHGQEVLEAVLTPDEIATLDRGKTVKTDGRHIEDAVIGFLCEFDRDDVHSLSKLFFEHRGERPPFVWFTYVLKRAFGVELTRQSRNRDRAEYHVVRLAMRK